MTDAGPDLSEIERDALTEIVNIGVGRAARNLSTMIRSPVQLSVPQTELLPLTQAAEVMARRSGRSLVAVSQEFQGSFSGRALLIFPEENSLELVRAVVGDGMDVDEIIDLEQEALAEIGNVILNGCLVVVANLLRHGLSMSLPRVLRGSSHLVMADPGGGGGDQDHVLFLRIDFRVAARDIDGYIALLMDLPSLASLRLLIRDFVAGVADGAADR